MESVRLSQAGGVRRRAGVAGLCLLLLLSGCARWSIKDRLFPPQDVGELEGVLRVGVDRPPEYDYRVGPGDTLMLRFFYYPEMVEPTIEVPSTGIVHLPLVGGVEVIGYTEAELNTLLNERYAKFLMFPDVVARVTSRKHDAVYMDGVVAGLATLPYFNTLTLVESLKKVAMARDGALHSVVVIRGLSTPDYRAFRINAKNVLQGKEHDIYLEPNDIVYVPSKFIVDVNLFVRRYVDGVLGQHIMPANVFPQAFPYTGDINYQIGVDFLDVGPNP